ncbi:MAG TPA: (Fe-S)-binding protein [Desulfosalsimonadaceae bacterium]|nr:(Fe-S)-binding protein [Desulfosalsimonadaceae bacterium]
MAHTDIDAAPIQRILKNNKREIKLGLKVCAHCSLCAESCFLYAATKDPKYMPSYKFINSIGRLYRKNGKVSREELTKIRDIVWHDCVLCSRCYCPFGINIPSLIALARQACRTQDLYREYDKEPMGTAT